MSKTKIEWCDYTINPVKGLCPMACPYCYARRMYKRFGWNPEIRMEPDWMEDLPKKPSRVFVGSTMELFGDWVEEWMWDSIRQYVNDYPQHTFIFLTKKPGRLLKFSPFPPNVWVGASATDYEMFQTASKCLEGVDATVKFISFEPLQNMYWTSPNIQYWLITGGIKWCIIGQQTPSSKKTEPKIEWIKEIVSAADKAGVKVFLKDNLKKMVLTVPEVLGCYSLAKSFKVVNQEKQLQSLEELRQEFPNQEK